MRLIYFGANPLAYPAIRTWSQRNDVEVTCVHEGLNADNIGMVEGHDGICLYLSDVMRSDERIYRTLHEYGIRQLSITATGVDGLNRQYAQQYGFHVTNVPGYSPTSVGHFALMSVLMGLRCIAAVEKDALDSRTMIGRELSDVTVGVLGTGRIGSVVADGVMALGGHVIACSARTNPLLEGRVRYVDFDRLLEQSDVISIHVPLTEETYHQFDFGAFSRMKEGSCLVNTARGAIVDTEALLAALDAGRVGGAVLDCVEHEEQYMATGWKDNPLVQRLVRYPNVMVTPHVAYYTQRAVDEIAVAALDNAKNVIETGRSVDMVL
ncbi:NAD(P)-dependent oxidoreductase [Bifidobacterium apri]|uniref:NAD(P)-dependent oxidoreductase n=1 Tax=Bifidobacterium apri TaxID=1769423 RepID=UPI0039934CE5